MVETAEVFFKAGSEDPEQPYRPEHLGEAAAGVEIWAGTVATIRAQVQMESAVVVVVVVGRGRSRQGETAAMAMSHFTSIRSRSMLKKINPVVSKCRAVRFVLQGLQAQLGHPEALVQRDQPAAVEFPE